MADDGYTVVFNAKSMMEAELIKGLLEGEGIDARIPGELSMDPWTTTLETLGDIPIEVPDASSEAAQVLIAESRKEGEQESQLENWIAEHGDEVPESEKEHEPASESDDGDD